MISKKHVPDKTRKLLCMINGMNGLEMVELEEPQISLDEVKIRLDDLSKEINTAIARIETLEEAKEELWRMNVELRKSIENRMDILSDEIFCIGRQIGAVE